jgi:hypothetical protein
MKLKLSGGPAEIANAGFNLPDEIAERQRTLLNWRARRSDHQRSLWRGRTGHHYIMGWNSADLELLHCPDLEHVFTVSDDATTRKWCVGKRVDIEHPVVFDTRNYAVFEVERGVLDWS